MTYKLKRISAAGITEAIAKVELYRSLNEPEEAESICRDVLAIEPQHQLALRLLGLALTDQFTGGTSDRYREAETTFQQLSDPYERLYYAGQPSHTLLPLFDQALRSFAEAEKIRPAGNDDTILRWNRCVRLLQTTTYEWEQEPASFDVQDVSPT
jgi:tetratricopeptide (TPR) repeat protein